mgnify:CR=1 FL=1
MYLWFDRYFSKSWWIYESLPLLEYYLKEVKLLKEENVPYIVIGNGSNLLVKDGGVRGVVIEISDNFNDFNIDGNIVNIQSGALLSFVGKSVLRAELKDLNSRLVYQEL